MTPPEPLLLAAHRDADDTAARACADWFEEHDQPERARYARLCCDGHAGGPGAADALEEAERLLYRQPAGGWASPPRGPWGEAARPSPAANPRGLPVSLQADQPGRLVECADDLFDRWPARTLRLSRVEPRQLRDLFEGPAGPRLCGLDLGMRADRDERAVRALTRHGDALRLASLELTEPTFGSADAAGLAEWAGLAGCRRLSLQRLPAPVDWSGALAHPALERLELAGNRFPYMGAAGNPHLVGRELATLGEPGRLPRLRHLGVTNLQLGERACVGLDAPGRFAGLESLHLSALVLTTPQATAFGLLLRQLSVRSLDLSWSQFEESRGLGALLDAWGDGGGVAELNLTGVPLFGEAAVWLAAWPGLPRLRRLVLNQARVEPAGLTRLLEGGRLSGLRHLDLTGVALSAPLLARMAEGPRRTTLRELAVGPVPDIAGYAARRAWARALVAAPGLRRLHVLHVPLGDAGVGELAGRGDPPELEQLTLASAGVSAAGVDRLLRADTFARLWRVVLVGGPALPERLPGGWVRAEDGSLVRPEAIP